MALSVQSILGNYIWKIQKAIVHTKLFILADKSVAPVA